MNEVSLKRKLEDERDRDEDFMANHNVFGIGVVNYIKRFFKPFDARTIAACCVGKGKYAQCSSAQEVLKVWEENRAFGEYVHQLIEDYLVDPTEFQPDGEVPVAENACLHQFKQWFEEQKFKGFEAEYKLFDTKGGLIGRIDLLAWDEDGKVTLVDLKVTDEISDKNFDDARGLVAPCTQLFDTTLVRASLQVHHYAEMLDLGHELKVDKLVLLQLHPSQDAAKEIEPLPLAMYAKKMIAQRRLEVQIQAESRKKRRRAR